MPAPRRHEEPEGERDGQPVGGEKVLGCWFANGTGLVGLDKAVDPDGEDDWRCVSMCGDYTMQVKTYCRNRT